jgi:hypothetical protein
VIFLKLGPGRALEELEAVARAIRSFNSGQTVSVVVIQAIDHPLGGMFRSELQGLQIEKPSERFPRANGWQLFGREVQEPAHWIHLADVVAEGDHLARQFNAGS